MNILLFDMDGVLLEPHGYHLALQETVALVGRVLGYAGVELMAEDIVALEAAGVDSEWDSSAICAVLLLETLWANDPSVALPPTLSGQANPLHSVPSPDFRSFTQALSQEGSRGVPPLERAERWFLRSTDSRTSEQNQAIHHILRTARQIDGSLTHRTFQELVLGSRLFAETYGLQPSRDTQSYLAQYDRPTLSSQQSADVLQWLQDAGNRAVIVTGRPSRPPAGHLGAPEAEIGAQCAGLATLPLLGQGGLQWLSSRRRCDPEAYLKPSPVHTLSALRLALGDPLSDAMEAAAGLALDNQVDAAWEELDGARVYVFEDTAPGLESICGAEGALREAGVSMELSLYGITDQGPKRQALEAVGATVVPSLPAALSSLQVVSSGWNARPAGEWVEQR